MKRHDYFPIPYFPYINGMLSGFFAIVTMAVLLFSIWSMCCLIGGFIGTARGVI